MTEYPAFIVTPANPASTMSNYLRDITAILATHNKAINSDGSWRLDNHSGSIDSCTIELGIAVNGDTIPDGILLGIYIANPTVGNPPSPTPDGPVHLRPYINGECQQGIIIEINPDPGQQQVIWILLDIPHTAPPPAAPPYCIQVVLEASKTGTDTDHDFDFYGATGELL
jgi:hypothetical protein